MSRDADETEQIFSIMNQLEEEVGILGHAVDNIDADYEAEYSEKVMRAELQQIADLVESFSEVLGEGEAISVAEVPIADEEE